MYSVIQVREADNNTVWEVLQHRSDSHMTFSLLVNQNIPPKGNLFYCLLQMVPYTMCYDLFKIENRVMKGITGNSELPE